MFSASHIFVIFCAILRTYFFYSYGDDRDLHSFPTRRSSDLKRTPSKRTCPSTRGSALPSGLSTTSGSWRSEEHTSELQSPYDLVCRLLHEKKKQRKAGICSKSMNSPAISASVGECTSVVTGIFSSRPMEARIWHPARVAIPRNDFTEVRLALS